MNGRSQVVWVTEPLSAWCRVEVGWTGMGELEYLTCSQVEEGGWGRLEFLCWGPGWEAAMAKLRGREGSECCRPG